MKKRQIVDNIIMFQVVINSRRANKEKGMLFFSMEEIAGNPPSTSPHLVDGKWGKLSA
jgi:hypothetical protein